MRGTSESEENDFQLISPIFAEIHDPYGPEGILYLEIDFFSKFIEKTENRILSKPVIVRGIPWRILALCRGNSRATGNSRSNARNNSLGFFLQCNNEEAIEKHGIWRCHGSATLEVLSTNPNIASSKKITHSFHNNEVDWGFTNFESYENLTDPSNGYLDGDTLRLKCHFTADVPTGAAYTWDSKLHTGCIGLRNQGATCYMNSILQAFYFTPVFRGAVYEMEVKTEQSESNICLAMQRVFYELQTSKDAVETNSLTRAFGWDKLDAFNQHDVQEFCRVLLDNLETKMKGTPQESIIPSLFRGNMKSFIKCTDVEYESSRTEQFYDVQLNVLGMDSLENAFEAYTAIEVLDEDNKYDAGDFGLQRAEKGVKFVELPPILHVQLMRFQYCGVEQKVNERFTFPEQINLEKCSELSDQLTVDDCQYSLQAVLVHSGEFHGGHYVTFINTNLYETNANPELKPRWCKFDDDIVSRTTIDDAISSNFGGEKSMNTSAYMLVYVRNNCISKVLMPLTNEDIPLRVIETFEMERQRRNRMKKQREEESMFFSIPVVTPDIIAGHHGFDLIDINLLNENVPRESVTKKMKIYQLYEFIEKRFLVDRTEMMEIEDGDGYISDEDMMDIDRRGKYQFRLWRMTESSVERENRAVTKFRPDLLLNPNSDETLERIFGPDMDAIYVEMYSLPDEIPDWNKASVLVFVKYYDSLSETFNIVGHQVINHNLPIEKFSDQFCRMIGAPKSTKLKYYEEISACRITPIENPMDVTPLNLLCHNGAILVIERADHWEPNNNARLRMDEMYQSTYIEFHEIKFNKRENDELHNPIVKRIRLDSQLSSVSEQLVYELGCDAKNVLFWSKSINGRNEPLAEDYTNTPSKALLGRSAHDPRRFKKYLANFSIMPFPVIELQKRQQMKLFAMNHKMEVEEMTIFPPKGGTVSQILEEAKQYFKFSPNGSGQLRLLQIGTSPNYNRVYQIFNDTTTLVDIETKYMFKTRVEEIPEDELECNIDEFFCPVVHFDRDPTTRTFGTSFLIKVKNGELMSEVRERLRKRLCDVSDAEFAKYKFALLAKDKVCRYIEFGETDKVNLQDMSIQTTGNVPQVYIGIDHKSPVLHSNENAIRILN